MPPRHIGLNPEVFCDDSNLKMSLKHHNAKAAGTAPAMTPSQLAHELNNLLDGSLRQVGRVMRELKELGGDPAAQDQLAQQLRTADQSMHQMADVIERYANAPQIADSDPDTLGCFAEVPPTTGEIMEARGTLLDVLTHAINVYGPSIEQSSIILKTRLDPAITDLPAGPIYTVLANAINNAIQAIQRCDQNATGHCITVCITPTDQDVVVKVTDTGVGLDPVLFDRHGQFRYGVTTRRNGHGIGLDLCRRIASDLGGQLQLSANPVGRGTQVTLQYPHPAATAASSAEEARRAG
ncbi:MAG: sensor histidine kinase [Planctomycetota bacterium]